MPGPINVSFNVLIRDKRAATGSTDPAKTINVGWLWNPEDGLDGAEMAAAHVAMYVRGVLLKRLEEEKLARPISDWIGEVEYDKESGMMRMYLTVSGKRLLYSKEPMAERFHAAVEAARKMVTDGRAAWQPVNLGWETALWVIEDKQTSILGNSVIAEICGVGEDVVQKVRKIAKWLRLANATPDQELEQELKNLIFSNRLTPPIQPLIGEVGFDKLLAERGVQLSPDFEIGEGFKYTVKTKADAHLTVKRTPEP